MLVLVIQREYVMEKIAIVGGGISGLVARYRVSKQFPNAEIILYEKTEHLGGCIESSLDPYFFERGPRTIKASRSGALLQLIEELDLQSEIIYSSKNARKRYLWVDQKLRLFSSFIPRLIPALLREWRQPYPWAGDESVASFAERRLGKFAAETLFDPLALGIFAGDIHHLSVSACFPELKAMEQEYGSLTHAFFKRKKEKKAKGLLTLKNGLQTLIDRLAEKGRGAIYLNTSLEELPKERTILAVPAPAVPSFFKGDTVIETFFESIPSASLTVVNIAFKEKGLTPKGFGYLVPSKENETILGVVFDSSIFSSQDQERETRLTVMLRKGGREEALSALKRHLKIEASPSAVHVKKYPYAVPQYGVGHLERVDIFKTHLKEHYPHVTCIGNYLEGVSLNSCIKAARCYSAPH